MTSAQKSGAVPHEESISSLFLLLGSCVGSSFSCGVESTFYWEKWCWQHFQKLFLALLKLGLISEKFTSEILGEIRTLGINFFWKFLKVPLALIIFYKMITDNDALLKF